MKFKIGDKVKVKPFDVCVSQGDFVSDMEMYCGKTLTISEHRLHLGGYNVKETHWTFYDGMLEPATPVKKGIYIKVEKVWSANGKPVYKVLEISALPVLQLPIEYLKSYGSISYDCKKLIISTQLRHLVLLEPGVYYSKEHFENALEKIKAAGNMLAEINKKLKWSGVEEFTI